jgi:predicted dehydrogenase
MDAVPVRIAVVGLGYWGPNLVRNLVESGLFDIAYLCDTRPEALEGIGRRYPGPVRTTSYEEVLRDAAVDAVAIATPVSTHYALATAALAAGKHALVEKPLALSAGQAGELTQAADESGLVLMPGHTFLYSPSVRTIKQIFDSGELGEIYFVSSSRVNLGLHQPDVSVVWDLGPHDFSILRYWLDGLPVEVSAVSRSCLLPGLPDVCFINLRYASGTIAHVELAWLAPSKLRRTAVVGSEKMVVYDDTSRESVRIFDSGASIPDPASFGEYRATYRVGEIVSPRIDATEPLALELADFHSAIRRHTPLVSSTAIGLDVIRTIEAVDRSLAEGGAPVPMAEPTAATLEQTLQAQLGELHRRADGTRRPTVSPTAVSAPPPSASAEPS